MLELNGGRWRPAVASPIIRSQVVLGSSMFSAHPNTAPQWMDNEASHERCALQKHMSARRVVLSLWGYCEGRIAAVARSWGGGGAVDEVAVCTLPVHGARWRC